MQEARMPEALSVAAHCSDCGARLTRSECGDPWAICLSCTNGHRFFIMPDPPLAADTARCSAIRSAKLGRTPPEALASFWLADPAARSSLSEQLAEMLRVIVEDEAPDAEARHAHCPFCGRPLEPYDQQDVWVQGLRCESGHEWAARGGRLFTMEGRAHIIIHAQPSDRIVRSLVAGWLSGNPQLEPQLHPSIRGVLERSRWSPY
jgi:hypothetical protein